jgi:chemotaxis protein MotB
MSTKLTGVLMLVLLIGMSSCVSKKKFQELEDQKNELEQNLEALNTKVDELANENTMLTEENEEMSSKMSSMESKLSQVESKANKLESDLQKSNSELSMIKTDLNDAFSAADKAAEMNEARIQEMEDKLYLEVDDGINFRSGSARLSSEDTKSLEKIADMLKSAPGMQLIIEGHTDDVPISNDFYGDNWELSVARSVSIVRKLVDMGVNPAQLIAAGGGEHHPVADNDTAEGRKQNRRGDVIIIPKIGKLYKNYEKSNP